MKTRITELLDIQYPIIQGGLAHLAYAKLAAAVSNAGGLGQITATSLESADALRDEIRRTRDLTKHPFAVNIAISLHKAVDEFVDVLMDERVSAVTLTGGNPEPLMRKLEGTDVRKLILVSSVRQAQKAEKLGADAVIVVGQEGGGHIGRDDTGTIVLVPQVVDAISIPVVASGGIADGRGLLAALALGAEGIEMGTRFVATKECIAHEQYKSRLVQGTESGTVIIKKSIGAPGRVIRSSYADDILAKEAQGITAEELRAMITGQRNQNAVYDGDFETGFAFAGQSMGLIHSIPSVADLIADMVADARRQMDKINQI